MKDYEYAITPTSQFYYCGVPFRLDIKPKCNLCCLYCYAANRGGRRTDAKQIVNVGRLINKLKKSKEYNPASDDVITELLSHNYAIHFGGMSDPFSDEDCCRAVKEILSALAEANYPIILSTKKPSKILSGEYIFNKQATIIQVSLSIPNNNLQKLIEPSADDVESRLHAMEHLIKTGNNVVCRVQPIFPQFIDTLPLLIDNLAKIGCNHVILEFLKLPVEKNIMDTVALSEILGVDIYDYYMKNDATVIGREWLLPTLFRYEKLIKVKRYANNMGLTVSMADYGLYHISDTNCCCGLDKFNIAEEWNKGNYTYLVKNQDGLMYFSDLLRYWHPEKSMTKYINSHSRLEKNNMISHLNDRWNKPGTVNAPDCFLGVEYIGEKDADNNCIYLNNSKTYREV